jgi:site-specific DNA recombinase
MGQEKDINHVALYLRISQEKKNENVETLKNHREILTEFCTQKGYTYVEFGEVISGGKTEIEDRVQLQKLLNQIEQFDAILVMELSRISRNGLISQTVKQYCIDYDKPIITPYQTYDLANNENHRLMFDLGSLISSHEHGVIGKRSKMNKLQMAKAGLHISGGVPFGYVRNNATKKLEINKEEAEIVRYIFQLHAKGNGCYKIRDILNEEGYKSAKGKLFSLPSVKRIIRNPHYKGWTVFQDRKRIKKQGKVTYEILDTIVVKDTHPAIIPLEEWEFANKDRDERAERYRNIREKPVIRSEITMLKDLVFCACCGWKMGIRKDGKNSTGYTIKRCNKLQVNGELCPNSGIKVESVEEEVWQDILEYRDRLITRVENLKKNNLSQMEQEKKQKMNQIRKHIKEIEEQEKTLIDLALSKLFSHEEILAKKQMLIKDKNNLEQQLQTIENQDDNETVEKEIDSTERIIKVIDQIPNKTPEIVNQNLKLFIKKIHYKRVIPKEILKLSTRNEKRKYYPFEIKVEYY